MEIVDNSGFDQLDVSPMKSVGFDNIQYFNESGF